jgi:hypothetical protein
VTLYNVPGTGYAQLIINAGDGPTMVINRDETNQIYVGDDNSVASKNGTGDVDIIDPLSFLVYDGIKSKYAIAALPGIEVQVNTIQGATNWAPSPAQAAFQISQLGLATETTQLANKTQLSNVNFNISAGTNPLLSGSSPGVATKVDTVNSTLGSPSQDPSTLLAADNILARETITPNPDFTNGSSAGWNANATFTVVTGGGLPPGAPRKWGAKIVPTGGLNPSLSSAAVQPCSPDNTIGLRAWVNVTGLTVPLDFYIQFFDANNTSLGFQNLPISSASTILNNWFHAHASFNVPNTFGGGTPAWYAYAIFLNGTPAANADTFYVQNFTAHTSGVPGMASSAFDISASGTPLLHGVNVLDQLVVNVGAGATVHKFYAVSKPGYLINIFCRYSGTNGTGTLPFVGVNLRWYDPASNSQMGSDQWYTVITPSGGFVPLYGKGPIKGPELDISFANFDNQPVNVSYEIIETTHHIARDDWRSDKVSGVNGFPGPTFSDPFALILGEVIFNGFGANAFVNALMPLYAGQVIVNISSSVSQAMSLGVNVQDAAMISAGGGNISIFNQTFAAARTFGPITINLPRAPCNFVLGNGPSSANVQMLVNSLEYAS